MNKREMIFGSLAAATTLATADIPLAFAGVIDRKKVAETNASNHPLKFTDDNATFFPYPANGFWSLNNTWGKQKLVNGKDFKESICVYPGSFPNKTTISWNWPKYANQGVLAYPEILFGNNPWRTHAVASPVAKRICQFNQLCVDYALALSGETENFNVAFDLWLTSEPNGDPTTRLCEVMIWIHPGWYPFGTGDFKFSSPTVSGELNLGAASATRACNIVSVVSHQKLVGKIDLLDVLKRLIPMSNGYISERMYLSGVEIGCEIARGYGSLIVNSLAYKWI